MPYGPWIQHSGKGQPGIITFGTRVMAKLIDQHFVPRGTAEFIYGEESSGEGWHTNYKDGHEKSWKLPIHPHWLYVAEYRIWYDEGEADTLSESMGREAEKG
jgi:hypothetical protein